MKDFISISRVLLLDMNVALKAVNIRQKIRIKLPDAVIVATAIVYELALAI